MLFLLDKSNTHTRTLHTTYSKQSCEEKTKNQKPKTKTNQTNLLLLLLPLLAAAVSVFTVT